MLTAADGPKARVRWFLVLGGVSTTFKKEIKPYEKYEVWTRVLCWDRKWLYVISQFIKAGTAMPAEFILDNGVRDPKSDFSQQNGQATGEERVRLQETTPKPVIFGTSISKYVTKVGRLTVHPEATLDAAGLLPPRPGGWHTTLVDKQADNGPVFCSPTLPDKLNSRVFRWDWKRIEAENARGLEHARHFAALDELHDEFTSFFSI